MSCLDGGSIVCTDSLSNLGTSSVSCPSLCHPFLKTKFQVCGVCLGAVAVAGAGAGAGGEVRGDM